MQIFKQGGGGIVGTAAYLQTAQKLGIEVAYGSGDEFEKQVRDEDIAFKALVKDLGLTPN